MVYAGVRTSYDAIPNERSRVISHLNSISVPPFFAEQNQREAICKRSQLERNTEPDHPSWRGLTRLRNGAMNCKLALLLHGCSASADEMVLRDDATLRSSPAPDDFHFSGLARRHSRSRRALSPRSHAQPHCAHASPSAFPARTLADCARLACLFAAGAGDVARCVRHVVSLAAPLGALLALAPARIIALLALPTASPQEDACKEAQAARQRPRKAQAGGKTEKEGRRRGKTPENKTQVEGPQNRQRRRGWGGGEKGEETARTQD